MAAAARRDDPDAPLKEIRNRLAALKSEIDRPSILENNIERVRKTHMRALSAAVAEYAGKPESPAGRAARIKIQHLGFAIDAFYDFVTNREDHESYEHVIGRARVAEYLLDTIEKTIDHFGTP